MFVFIQNKTTICFVFTSLFLISCATTNNDKIDFDETIVDSSIDIPSKTADADKLITQGKVKAAVKLYLRMANRSSNPDRANILLKSIHLLIDIQSFETASKILRDIDSTELTPDQLIHFAYINARLAVNVRDAKTGRLWIDYLDDENYLGFTTHADALKLEITIYLMANDNQSATLARIKLVPHLISDPEIVSLQHTIIRGLLLLNEEELIDISENDDAPNGVAWSELAMLVKKSKNPFRLGNQLASWKELNPNNPIRDEILASLAPQYSAEKLTIDNVALLLPLSGPFAKPARAIRDGFLANYYAEDPTVKKPIIRIYNTAINSSKDKKSILTIYDQAMKDGADIIIGPLQKNAIDTLTKNRKFETPTLALNQLKNNDFYAKNFYQFSLSPEQEAEQTALRAWQDGHSRAAIIYPDNKWGIRVIDTFKNKWLELGGEIVAESGYKTKNNDFSKPIKSLLAIDKSHERKQKLSKLLRTKLVFEPRRRQDIDFIFMATFPRQARLIPPQFKFYRAEKLPIYSTSHSFSGRIDRKKDRDLNSVIVGDMPWTLTNTKSNNTKLQIYQTWPNKSKLFNRFYAFGNDTYYILNYLSWLRNNSESRLEAQTGNLHMNESNKIVRNLIWAKFKNGKPILLPIDANINN